MEYKFNRKLMITNLIVCVILIALVIRTEGMNVITQKTNIINCPEDSNLDCTYINEEGKIITLPKGTNITTNYHPPENLKLANYGVLTSTILFLIVNHFKYNKGYPIRKKLKELLKYIRTMIDQK